MRRAKLAAWQRIRRLRRWLARLNTGLMLYGAGWAIFAAAISIPPHNGALMVVGWVLFMISLVLPVLAALFSAPRWRTFGPNGGGVVNYQLPHPKRRASVPVLVARPRAYGPVLLPLTWRLASPDAAWSAILPGVFAATWPRGRRTAKRNDTISELVARHRLDRAR